MVLDFANIDILANNAGMDYKILSGPQQVINVNLTSLFECIKGILPLMREQNRDTIVNLADLTGKQVFANLEADCLSMGRLNGSSSNP